MQALILSDRDIEIQQQEYKMTSNFEKLIPREAGVLLSIKTINDLGIIKKDMMRKIILNKGITVVKLGSKNFIDRGTLIEYLESNVISATN
ncbi:MAG: DNA-binding protein [Campylobacterales bacterium]|nr:DNA-binding protein [Campylobacterales bacterium]